MIPGESELLDTEISEETGTSRTYALNHKTGRIAGFIDEIEAVKQAVYKTLNTERYDYPIYSWDYGFEVKDLYGEDDTFVIPELERRIIDALSVDDRILGCSDFEFDTSKRGVVAVKFTVSTIFGQTEQEVEVDV